jgi:uncharacterized membrane protein
MRLREAFRSSLVVVPGLVTLALLALSVVTVRADDWLGPDNIVSELFRGNVASARSALSAIATATITLTALVFSVTMLVLQMASAQYSPRVLRTFLRDLNSQVTLGVFVGTFVYALSVLRSLDTAADEAASGIAMSVAVLLAIASVAAFVQYINHIAHRIRIASIIGLVAQETTAAIDRCYESGSAVDAREPLSMTDGAREVLAPRSGVVTGVDVERLVARAAQHDARVRLSARVGEFRPRRSAVAGVDGGDTMDDRVVLDAIHFAGERTLVQDPSFGFRQLVDIAVRALSASLNDPTTAVQVIDHLHDLLRELSYRELGSRQWRDGDGTVRLEIPDLDWDDYVSLAVDELVHYGRSHPPVVDRLHTMLRDLQTITTDGRRRTVVAKLRGMDTP